MAGQVLKITEMRTTVVVPQVAAATLFEDCNALATMRLKVFIIRTSYGMQAYMAQLMFESIYFVSRIKCIIME